MKTRFLVALASVALVCAAFRADAIFLKPDLTKIPVERLIANLQKQLDSEVKITTNTRYNLARTHAMAYALKVDSVDVEKKAKPGEGPYFGPTPQIVPFKATETTDKAKLEQAQKHLEKAIGSYKELLKEQPNHVAGMLGLTWCQEQAGEKDEAIKGYRTVLEKAWEKERKLKAGPLGGNFMTKEAAGYLIPLLDAKTDADEIEGLKTRVAVLGKLPRPVTPIAIPLKDGLSARDLEDRTASVAFDADGSALGKRWTWITPDAAWLVHDPKHTGKITSGLQLFGNVTFWCFWENGYEALRSLDDNGDGIISGAELAGLALWHDANGNGICDEGEVRPLSAHGIVSLSCQWQTDTAHPDRIAYSVRGATFQNGTTRPTFDLILQSR
jgi:tetratricopeptide (TPR) repeat protein